MTWLDGTLAGFAFVALAAGFSFFLLCVVHLSLWISTEPRPMNAILTTLNAWRLQHGRLFSVLGLLGTALVSAAAGDWGTAAATLLTAFGLHHSPPAKGGDAGAGAPPADADSSASASVPDVLHFPPA